MTLNTFSIDLKWPHLENEVEIRKFREFEEFFRYFVIFVKNLNFSSSQVPFKRVYTIFLNFDLWWPRMTSESLLRKAF